MIEYSENALCPESDCLVNKENTKTKKDEPELYEGKKSAASGGINVPEV